MKTEKEFLESVYRKYNVAKIRKARKRKALVSVATFVLVCLGVSFPWIFLKENTVETTSSEETFFSEAEESEELYSSEEIFVSEGESSEDAFENERIVYGEKHFFGISSEAFKESEEAESGVECKDMEYFFSREEFDGAYYYVGIKAIISSTEENVELVREYGVEEFRKRKVLELMEHFESIGLSVKYMKEFDLFVTYIKEADFEKLSTEKASLLVYHLPLDFEFSDGL